MAFLCLGKNIERNFPSVLRQIDELGALFKTYRVLMIDGASTDATRSIFDAYALSTKAAETKFVSVPSENLQEGPGPFAGKTLSREGRIAVARNVGLQELSGMIGVG